MSDQKPLGKKFLTAPLSIMKTRLSMHKGSGLCGAVKFVVESSLVLHIFVAEKGDYYEITDGLPQNDY